MISPPTADPADDPSADFLPLSLAVRGVLEPGLKPAEYEARLKDLGRHLAPADPYDAMLVGMMLHALDMLRVAMAAAPKLDDDGNLAGEFPDARWIRFHSQCTSEVWRGVRGHQAERRERRLQAEADRKARERAEEEAELDEPDAPREPQPIDEPDDGSPVDWRERVALDTREPLHWPILTGCEIRVEDVAGLRGWLDDDQILEMYRPKLSRRDLRVCIQMDELNLCEGYEPFDYPPEYHEMPIFVPSNPDPRPRPKPRPDG